MATAYSPVHHNHGGPPDGNHRHPKFTVHLPTRHMRAFCRARYPVHQPSVGRRPHDPLYDMRCEHVAPGWQVSEMQERGRLMAQIESGRRVENSHIWQREEHEHYVEETWCSSRLFCVEKFQGRIVDPACGFGRVVKSAALAGYSAAGADIVQRAPGYPVNDFFQSTELADNFVSNPPFKQFQAFALHALACSTRKVALIWQVPRLNAARWHTSDPPAPLTR